MSAPTAALSKTTEPGMLAERTARLATLARDNFHFIWRSLRRLGVNQGSVDDAAQQVFEVASRRLEEIEPGRERAFLFKSAILVAPEATRRAATQRARDGGDAVDELDTALPSPEDTSDWLRRRLLLDRVLAAMPVDLRVVFVLFELEELSMLEIARLLELRPGTVASRLRRAREAFHSEGRRCRSLTSSEGRTP